VQLLTLDDDMTSLLELHNQRANQNFVTAADTLAPDDPQETITLTYACLKLRPARVMQIKPINRQTDT
jgi:hypothetical protein